MVPSCILCILYQQHVGHPPRALSRCFFASGSAPGNGSNEVGRVKEAASGRLATLLLKGSGHTTDSGDSLVPLESDMEATNSVDEPKLDESLSCLYQAAAKIYSCILTVKAPTPRTGALSFEMQTFLFCFSYYIYII